jgi:hypothetical protein
MGDHSRSEQGRRHSPVLCSGLHLREISGWPMEKLNEPWTGWESCDITRQITR